jgi:hypothetical protein
MAHDPVIRYLDRVGYSSKEAERFMEKNHRPRHVRRIDRAAPVYSIVAEVVKSRHCNSGHVKGQKLVLDVDGNLITKLCPKKICVYLVSQLTIPVALVNERLGEGWEPNDFHFMHFVHCPDTGVECLGYGEVMLRVRVIPRD